MLNEWSTKEKLALASSVVRSGDSNWTKVSKLVRPFATAIRSNDYFSQTNCAQQYSQLLKLVEGTCKRKKGDEEEGNYGEIIVQKLTSERIKELKGIISEQAEKYRSIVVELEDIKRGKYDNKMKEKWMQLQSEKRKASQLAANKLIEENEEREKAKKVLLNESIDRDLNVDNSTKLNLSTEEIKVNNDINDNSKGGKSPSLIIERKVSPIRMSTSKSSPIKILPLKLNSPIKEDKSPVKVIEDIAPLSITNIIDNAAPTLDRISSILENVVPTFECVSPVAIGELTDDKSDARDNTNDASQINLIATEINREILPTLIISPIGTTSAFKIFQKETITTSKNEQINDSQLKNSVKINDIEALVQQSNSSNIEEHICENDNLIKDVDVDATDEANLKVLPKEATNTEEIHNFETNNPTQSEDGLSNMLPTSTNLITKSPILNTDSAENSAYSNMNTNTNILEDSEYSNNTLNEKSFEFEGTNINVKLKFDVAESLPGSPASISTSDTEDERSHKIWKKSIMLVWRAIANHKFANVFLHPVTEDIAPGYHSIVKRPMDLITIRKNIDVGTIRTTSEFQRDVMLMFVNAIMYNDINQYVHIMARTMFRDAMAQIEQFVSTQMMVQTEPKLLRTLRRNDINSSNLYDKGEEEIRKRRNADLDIITSSKKEKSTDCDSALIPLLCVHG